MKINPANDRILVLPCEQATMKGSIIIPPSAQERSMEGTVVAAGPGRLREDGTRAEMSVAVGDRVLIGGFVGTEIKVDGIEHVLITEADVLATLN
jgi:chaperonin GroES